MDNFNLWGWQSWGEVSMHSMGQLLTVFIVIGLPVLCVTVFLLALLFRGGNTKKSQAYDADETRLIQELHRDLNRLEKRLESIETILFENERIRERIK